VREDKIANIFIDKMETSGLVDVEPVQMKETWFNIRSGDGGA
jgi:hypothetical protein